MIAPLATLVFLGTLWLVAVAAADLLGRSSSKMLLALKGRSPLAAGPAIAVSPIRISPRVRPQLALRAQPRLRNQPRLREQLRAAA